MRYFFVNPENISYPDVLIQGNDAKHIRTVLRLKPGSLIRLTDGSGVLYESRIVHYSDKGVNLKIIAEINEHQNSKFKITVAQPLLKNTKMDQLIRPLSELGVSKWIVFLSERSVARPSVDRLSDRENRWRKIARESLKQCGRAIPMDIVTVFSFQEMLELSAPCDYKIFFWEKAENVLDYTELVQKKSVNHIFSLFGPEGGFSENEYQIATRHGFTVSSLGPRILKAETAPLAACAILQYLFGDMGPQKHLDK